MHGHKVVLGDNVLIGGFNRHICYLFFWKLSAIISFLKQNTSSYYVLMLDVYFLQQERICYCNEHMEKI